MCEFRLTRTPPRPCPPAWLLLTWMTSPVPSKPAAVSGSSVTVALCIIDRAAALRRRVLSRGSTLRTSALPDRKETRPMKHATRSSDIFSSSLTSLSPLFSG